jgi:hypothetical protein
MGITHSQAHTIILNQSSTQMLATIILDGERCSQDYHLVAKNDIDIRINFSHVKCVENKGH